VGAAGTHAHAPGADEAVKAPQRRIRLRQARVFGQDVSSLVAGAGRHDSRHARLGQYDIRRILEAVVRLSASDYRDVLAVLREAGEVEGPMPFPEPVLDALRRLVPCDVVTYHERVGGHPALATSGEPRGSMTGEIRAACRQYWHQDRLAPSKRPRKVSDVLSQREFHRTELYQYVSSSVGIEDMFRLWLASEDGGGVRLEFDRPRRDFSERDRDVLDVLLPHLTQLHKQAAARRRVPLRLTRTFEKLTPREQEILELVAEGRTNKEISALLWISSGTVRKHLENAFEKLEVHTRTAAAAAVSALREGVRGEGPKEQN
jgi:DNA-binding CsgD family transcriptional regulator